MTSGTPTARWVDQFLEAKKLRATKEKEEWERISPEEREERIRKISEEKKKRSRLW
jgi:acyl-CoA reductase-like NAD-dependent aldehyde dehydrogenase